MTADHARIQEDANGFSYTPLDREHLTYYVYERETIGWQGSDVARTVYKAYYFDCTQDAQFFAGQFMVAGADRSELECLQHFVSLLEA